ncbi:hypothetical protein [Candidatus Poriferisodalis sp.]|uniref:hypothetical protein n=1 Tax=Candidatus Poriferisodalis sp. TaxID=3101277 RepID=UPI003B023DE6
MRRSTDDELAVIEEHLRAGCVMSACIESSERRNLDLIEFGIDRVEVAGPTVDACDEDSENVVELLLHPVEPLTDTAIVVRVTVVIDTGEVDASTGLAGDRC